MLYNQRMKLVSGERAAVSGMKHGSVLIMHSSSLEHFRTGGEGDGTRLQIGAGKGETPHSPSSPSVCTWISASENVSSCSPSASPLRLCWTLVPGDMSLSKPIFEVPLQLSRFVK